MAIEIRELIIRTRITSEPERNVEGLTPLNKRELTEQCVQQVLRKLKKKIER